MAKAQYVDYRVLKAELPFALVLSHYNIEHSQSRVQDSVSCPFHDDDKPSCSINKDKGIFKCFGCQAKGNVLSFICLMEELDEDKPGELNQAGRYAVEKILGKLASDFSKKGRASSVIRPAKAKSETAPAKPEQEEPAVKINAPLSFSLNHLITEHPFIDEHDLTDKIVETFGLGICETGIMKDRFVIPIHNSRGELVAYSGRWLDDNPPEGEGKYKLPKGFNKNVELFNQHRARTLLKEQANDEIVPLVIVEGFWSVLRLHAQGIPAVATFGAGISEIQARLIASLTEEAVIVFDGDEAGREGMARGSALLSQQVFVKSVMLSEGEKPDTVNLDLIEQAWM